VPVTLLRTNACSPLATNALRGNIWDNFSSESYKRLPSVGVITVADPFDGTPKPYAMPAGGRGYTRPPSLISLWSTAPYLLNNSVGPFSYRQVAAPDGRTFEASPMVGVDDRMKVFEPSIEQMLWPQKRDRDPILGAKVHGVIDRTTSVSWIVIAPHFLPDALKPAQGVLKAFYPGSVYDPAQKASLMRQFPGYPNLGPDMKGALVLGPIPEGMPVNLLANVKLQSESANPIDGLVNTYRLLVVAHYLKRDLKDVPTVSGPALRDHFDNVRKPLLALSKCPDFVVNKGHLFGTDAFNNQAGLSKDERSWGVEPPLGDEDKRALVAFLKTF
jgi:hypothetical protein